jgi:hypothetical protein
MSRDLIGHGHRHLRGCTACARDRSGHYNRHPMPDAPIKRPVGRPRQLEPAKAVTVYLPVPKVDQLIRVANKAGISVSAAMRRLLIAGLKDRF